MKQPEDNLVRPLKVNIFNVFSNKKPPDSIFIFNLNNSQIFE